MSSDPDVLRERLAEATGARDDDLDDLVEHASAALVAADLANDHKRLWASQLDARLTARRPARPVLISQAPNARGNGWPALTGAAGDRIARLADLSYPGARPAIALMMRTERFNLVPYFPSTSVGGDMFPLPLARVRAGEILARLHGERRLSGRRILLFGGAVARCFGVRPRPFDSEARVRTSGRVPNLAWIPYRPSLSIPGWGLGDVEVRLAVCPHPSGRNRFWNSETNRRRAGEFLREALKEEP